MEIKTTEEIISNIYQKPKFRCPECNTIDIVDIPRKSIWQCLSCGSLFKSPLVTYDEGKIDINKKWVSVEDLIEELKKTDKFTYYAINGNPSIYDFIENLKKELTQED